MLGVGIILLSITILGVLVISIAAFEKAKLNEKRIMSMHKYLQEQMKG